LAGESGNALGVVLNSNGSGGTLMSTFDNQPVTAADVLVKYTCYGDALLNGNVTAADYLQIDNAFSYNATHPTTPLTGWNNGDFNYDGVINGDDYTLIDNAYNSQVSVSFAALPASDAAQFASTSQASTVVGLSTEEVRQFAVTVANSLIGDNTDARELKKGRPSAWEMLES